MHEPYKGVTSWQLVQHGCFLLSPVVSLDAQSVDPRPSCEACLAVLHQPLHIQTANGSKRVGLVCIHQLLYCTESHAAETRWLICNLLFKHDNQCCLHLGRPCNPTTSQLQPSISVIHHCCLFMYITFISVEVHHLLSTVNLCTP